jgi:hypothetical protein
MGKNNKSEQFNVPKFGLPVYNGTAFYRLPKVAEVQISRV